MFAPYRLEAQALMFPGGLEDDDDLENIDLNAPASIIAERN